MNLKIEESEFQKNEKKIKKRKSYTEIKEKEKYIKIFKKFLKKVNESYECNFCKEPFKEDDYLGQLQDHLKNFHNIREKEFNQLLKPLIKTYKMKKEDVSNSKVGLSYIKTSKIKLHEKNGQSKNDEVNKELN